MFISLYLVLKSCVDAILRGPESLLTASAALGDKGNAPRPPDISYFSLACRTDRRLGYGSFLFAGFPVDVGS
jgi:hypothetical protein